MIQHVPFESLGKANHGWLRANHHFSFARYYNPERMGFGSLRVINDDWVAPGTGFSPHPHKNMEIISFIRSGAVTHEDNQGNKGLTSAGEVQVMSAGTGIVHSEFNRSAEPLTLFQIWIEPNEINVKPRWDSKLFTAKATEAGLPLLVSGDPVDKDKALFIYQDARIYGGTLQAGHSTQVKIKHQAYVLASKASVALSDGQHQLILKEGDGARVTEVNQLSITALDESDAEVIVIDAPKN
ncbi:pirin family protein [Gayadomonas joobiniege]|uniref:pirin family protein n=1 Tax=Gayadomonas joobiniege TaxID=1234606 RepID=UPI000361594C|nr:pirin family protein [Gayadomonas joobiniege]